MKLNNFYASFVIVIVSWFTIYSVLDSFSLWFHWGIPSMNFLFPDLHTLLTAIDAHFLGFNVFVENPLCYFKIPHAYSEAWFIFHYFGFNDHYRVYIGIFLIIFFAILVSWQIKDKPLFFLPLLCSPSIMFALERCNSDILIFILVFISCKLCLSKKIKWFWIGHLLLSFSIALKYYPVAAAIIIFFRKEKLHIRFILFSTQIIFFLFWIYYCWDNLKIQKAFIPEPGYFSSFGFSPLIAFFTNITGSSELLCMAILIVITLFISFKFFKIYKNHIDNSSSNLSSNQFPEALCACGLSIIAFCYFIKTSFDYRLIFLFFIFPFILNLKIKIYKDFRFFFITPLFFLYSCILTVWFEFIREWITIFAKFMEIDNYLPNLLFITRTSEIFLNHYLITISLSYCILIFYTHLFIKKKLNN